MRMATKCGMRIGDGQAIELGSFQLVSDAEGSDVLYARPAVCRRKLGWSRPSNLSRLAIRSWLDPPAPNRAWKRQSCKNNAHVRAAEARGGARRGIPLPRPPSALDDRRCGTQ